MSKRRRALSLSMAERGPWDSCRRRLQWKSLSPSPPSMGEKILYPTPRCPLRERGAPRQADGRIGQTPDAYESIGSGALPQMQATPFSGVASIDGTQQPPFVTPTERERVHQQRTGAASSTHGVGAVARAAQSRVRPAASLGNTASGSNTIRGAIQTNEAATSAERDT